MTHPRTGGRPGPGPTAGLPADGGDGTADRHRRPPPCRTPARPYPRRPTPPPRPRIRPAPPRPRIRPAPPRPTPSPNTLRRTPSPVLTPVPSPVSPPDSAPHPGRPRPLPVSLVAPHRPRHPRHPSSALTPAPAPDPDPAAPRTRPAHPPVPRSGHPRHRVPLGRGGAARAGAGSVAGPVVRGREGHGRLSGRLDRAGVRGDAADRGRAGLRAGPGVQPGPCPAVRRAPRAIRCGRWSPAPCPGWRWRSRRSGRCSRWPPRGASRHSRRACPTRRSPWTAPGSPRPVC